MWAKTEWLMDRKVKLLMDQRITPSTRSERFMTDLTSPSILLVDSDSESLFFLASILIAHNYRVITSRSSQDALKYSLGEPLDLLITENRLSDGDGITLVSNIREASEHSDLPVMYLSQSQKAGVIRRMHDFGAAFHLKKPIVPSAFIELVERALWMPHLVRNQIEQNTIKQPHVSFAQNPMTDSFLMNPQVIDVPQNY